MRTRRVLTLLCLLSALTLLRAGLSLWSDSQPGRAVIKVAQAAQEQPSRSATPPAPPATTPPEKRNPDPAANSKTKLARKFVKKPTASGGLIPAAEALPFTPDAEAISQAERETLLSLRQTKQALDARQKALDEREQAARTAEAKIARRLKELEAMESGIKDLLAQEQSINTKKIKRLTAVYEAMKADRSAPVIARMELPIIVRMFSRMDEKKVGKILSFLPPEKAVVISQALTDRISDVK